jgi:hypothetical protein
MKGSFLKVAVLLTVGFGVSFADSSQELNQEGKVLDQKSVELTKEDMMNRLNDSLSNTSQSVKDCIFKASTIEQLEACHRQSR